MRRITAITALTAALAFAPSAASAAENDDGASRRPGSPSAQNDGARHRRQPIRLQCRPAMRDNTPTVGCRWSRAHHPRFAGYRLFRAERGQAPTLVFQSSELGATSFADTSVTPDHRYAYVVKIVNANGRVIGRSRAEHVRCCPVRPAGAERSARPARPDRPERPAVTPAPLAP